MSKVLRPARGARSGTCTFDRSRQSLVFRLQQHNCGFEVPWFDPRLGGALKCGSVETVSGPGVVLLGAAPDNPDADWVVVVRARMEP